MYVIFLFNLWFVYRVFWIEESSFQSIPEFFHCFLWFFLYRIRGSLIESLEIILALLLRCKIHNQTIKINKFIARIYYLRHVIFLEAIFLVINSFFLYQILFEITNLVRFVHVSSKTLSLVKFLIASDNAWSESPVKLILKFKFFYIS